ncbi:MAG: galactokinase family protein, partial [Phycisphaerae bacterium]
MDQPTASTSGQPVGPQSLTWWHHGLDSPSGRLAERLVQLYGPDQAQLAERRAALSRALAHFQQSYDSPGPLAIARAPGRLNTLGRHIDHRGGYVNPVSLHFETLLVFFARHDDLVRISDTNPAFGSRQFRIAELLPDRPICDLGAWLSWTQQQADQRASAGTRSDWVHKIAAPAVYLQHIYQPQIRLRGFDGVLYGSVPQAMGLSSSSSLVVAATEALLAVNRLDLPADEYPLRCGEMEWYVGTRGGCGDHAAIKLARPGQIMHMRTEPVLMLRKHLPFPTGYQLLVFDSGIVADKTGRAGQRFNANTATYAIGELYARRWLKHNAGWLYEQLTSARADRPVDRQIFLAD